MINLQRHPQPGLVRHFDRANDHRIEFPLTEMLKTSPGNYFTTVYPISISMWLKPANATAEQIALYIGSTTTSSNHHGIGIDAGNGFMDVYAATHDRIYTANSYTNNAWNHIAVRILASDDRHVYLNGDVGNKASSVLLRNVLQGTAPKIILGWRGDTSPGDAYDGLIAYVTIWDGENGDIGEDNIVRLANGAPPKSINPATIDWEISLTEPTGDVEKTWGDRGLLTGTTGIPSWEVERPPIHWIDPAPPFFWAQGELLPIDLYPDAAVAGADSIDPTIGFGAININPIEVSAATASLIGGVDESNVDITPSPAEVVTSKSGPQVVQNSLAISPSAASANTAKVDPDVELDSILVDPASSAAVAESVDPQVYFTGIDITPDPAVVSCSGVDPDIDDAQNVFPSPVSAGADSIDPTLFFSSHSATPVPASAATLAFIDLEYTPTPASAGTSVEQPTIYIGGAITGLYPLAATAGTDVVDPTLFFTSFGQTPDPVSAGTDSVDPTYYVYGGGYPVVYTSPAVAIPVGIPPTTHQGSITLYPDVVDAVTESIDPELFWTSTSAAPDPAVAVTEVVAPIAGAFFRYFMEADISLGGWTNELDSSVDLYASIDEDPHDDEDYIQSDWGPEQETYKGKLERMSEPDDDTLHYIEYRYQKENDLTRVDMIVRLRQGESVITGWSHDDVGLDLVTQRQVLSEEEAALITNYQDLHLEFEAWERN